MLMLFEKRDSRFLGDWKYKDNPKLLLNVNAHKNILLEERHLLVQK